MPTDPAIAIKNEVNGLVQKQISTFGQESPLSGSQLQDCHARFRRLKKLYQELDEITRSRWQETYECSVANRLKGASR